MQTEPKPNPSTAWDDFADGVISSDEARRDYWRNRAKVEGAGRLAAAWERAAELHNIARKDLADRMHKQPSQITRLFAGMDGNPTLDTMVGASLAAGVKMTVSFELVDDDPNSCPLEVVTDFLDLSDEDVRPGRDGLRRRKTVAG